MTRAPFQVLVFPYRWSSAGQIEYAIFRRKDRNVWQGIAGGGEGFENPDSAAAREANEEAGIPTSATFVRLSSTGAVPVEHFDDRHLWDPELSTIPEYSFGVEIAQIAHPLSGEHSEVAWLEIDQALLCLEWETNRNALRELNERLGGDRAPG